MEKNKNKRNEKEESTNANSLTNPSGKDNKITAQDKKPGKRNPSAEAMGDTEEDPEQELEGKNKQSSEERRPFAENERGFQFERERNAYQSDWRGNNPQQQYNQVRSQDQWNNPSFQQYDAFNQQRSYDAYNPYQNRQRRAEQQWSNNPSQQYSRPNYDQENYYAQYNDQQQYGESYGQPEGYAFNDHGRSGYRGLDQRGLNQPYGSSSSSHGRPYERNYRTNDYHTEGRRGDAYERNPSYKDYDIYAENRSQNDFYDRDSFERNQRENRYDNFSLQDNHWGDRNYDREHTYQWDQGRSRNLHGNFSSNRGNASSSSRRTRRNKSMAQH